MADAEDWETLETLLNKATNPANRDEDWEYIINFCDKVNQELEGPQHACRLLGHKMQSPQERESMQSLTVVEACVKNCGEPFHREVGKFRFLNEMIKLISPKYLGGKTSDKLKKRTIELLYSWSKGLSTEPKIKEAYEMLKKQGLVKEDPIHTNKDLFPPTSPKSKMATFEDEERSKLLARLLKSKHPEDLQAANRLIKNMVKEDEKKMEKISRRTNELESCNNNVKLLNEMLTHYREGSTSLEEMELMKELYLTCERMRPSLFRLASDADEKDDCIADILETNDAVVRVMETYKEKIGVVETSGDEAAAATIAAGAQSGSGNKLIDLAGTSPVKQQSVPILAKPPDSGQLTNSEQMQPEAVPDSSLLLDAQLSSLGLGSSQSESVPNKVVQPTSASDLEKLLGPAPMATSTQQPSMVTQPFNAFPTSQPMQQTAMPMFPSQPQMIQQMRQVPQMRAPPMGMAGMHPAYPVMSQAPQRVPMAASQMPSVFPTQPVMPSSSAVGSGATPMTNSTNSKPAGPAISSDAFADLESLGRGLIKPKQKEDSGSQPTPDLNARQQQQQQDDQLLFLGGSPQAQASDKKAAAAAAPAQAAGALSAPAVAPATNAATIPAPTQSVAQTVLSLADVFVPLETIQPGATPPVTAYEKNNVKTVFHFGKDSPRPDIVVIVVSTMSTTTSPIKNLSFQAAVPKTMRVKLQPPSATDLPAFNPILPPSAITQVMLLANPNEEKIRLRFKMQYTLNDQQVTELGEVDKLASH